MSPNSDTGGLWVDPPTVIDAGRVMKFKRFLPRGPIKNDDGVMTGERSRSLIQVYTDPGGLRTLAVAEVSLKDPGRAKV
jgi:hypothetical protein